MFPTEAHIESGKKANSEKQTIDRREEFSERIDDFQKNDRNVFPLYSQPFTHPLTLKDLQIDV